MAYIRCSGGGTRPLTRTTLWTNPNAETGYTLPDNIQLSDDYDKYTYIGVKYIDNPTLGESATFYEALMPASEFYKTANDQDMFEHPMLCMGGKYMGAHYVGMIGLRYLADKRSIMATGTWRTYPDVTGAPTDANIYVPVEIYGLK